jgi:hypothetical protein
MAGKEQAMNDPTSGQGDVRRDLPQAVPLPEGWIARPADKAVAPPAPVPPPAEPFSGEEFRRVIARPHLLVEFILGGKDRLARSLADGKALGGLAAVLLAASILATIPYGLLSPAANFWKIATLYTGSLLICFPCLYAFGQFLGLRLDLARSLALALIITATAGLFTFAFAPIIWFITFSIRVDPQTAIRPRDLSAFLLAVSLLLGLAQMGRCLVDRNGPARRFEHLPYLMASWLPLLLFITWRMACLLELP